MTKDEIQQKVHRIYAIQAQARQSLKALEDCDPDSLIQAARDLEEAALYFNATEAQKKWLLDEAETISEAMKELTVLANMMTKTIERRN